MFSRTKSFALLVLALALPLAACDGGTGAEFGEVTLKLTDGPDTEVVKAVVTFTDIYLQGEDGEADPEGSRVYLLEGGNETHELLSLANTVADLVVGQEVPTGTYGQLRVVMSGACIETADGSVFVSDGYTPPADEEYAFCAGDMGQLQMPSFAQSGAKVQLNGLTVEGGQQILMLDFKVAESFGREAGNSNRWVMTPVIHTSEIDLTAGVDVTLSEGDVTLPEGYDLGQFSATLDPAGSDSSRVDFTDVDGDEVFEVEFGYLIPADGPFELRLNVPEGLTVTVSPEAPASLSPASGETATVDWVLQTAEESGAGL